jgi:hypothetical protein
MVNIPEKGAVDHDAPPPLDAAGFDRAGRASSLATISRQ